jgi:hypothetical protein
MSASKSVAEGEIIRRKEAMDSLVHEVSRGEDESLPPSLRSALEVSKVIWVLLSFVFIMSYFLYTV